MANTARTIFLHCRWTSFSGQFHAASINMRFNLTEEQHTSSSRHAILAFIVPFAPILHLVRSKVEIFLSNLCQYCSAQYDVVWFLVIDISCINSVPKLGYAGSIYGVHHTFSSWIATLLLLDSNGETGRIMPSS
ncbi:unnamed protein product [Ilex paraguariensis]|uniref:Uncharacterized protein n=1 Tax=Ilex paraguariensis TaxID=185542 RepID=A0ABC8U9X9_9AQUA